MDLTEKKEEQIISFKTILILSSHLRLDIPSKLVPFVAPSTSLHAFLFQPISKKCFTLLIVLDLLTPVCLVGVQIGVGVDYAIRLCLLLLPSK